MGQFKKNPPRLKPVFFAMFFAMVNLQSLFRILPCPWILDDSVTKTPPERDVCWKEIAMVGYHVEYVPSRFSHIETHSLNGP